MSDPFESADFSLRRAKRHVLVFNLAADAFMESEPYSVRTDFNAETRLNEVKVKLVRDFPEDLRGFASDAIKNIRDALDQAMSAASFVVTGKRFRRAHFPFGESADDLENSLSRRKASQCRDIPEELFPAIRYAKPYPHEGDEFGLKTLQKVSGPHKHSIALTLGCAPPHSFAAIQMGGVTMTFPEWRGDPSKDEVIIATHDGDGQMIFSAPFHIALDHPELSLTPASTVLGLWGTRSEWIVGGLRNFAAQIVAERG